MPCPFIRETSALSCRAAGIRKLIPGQALESAGRCSSPDWSDCPYSASAPDHAAPSCPFMEESLVQFCSAAPVTRFIPYSEPLLSRCGSDAYRYCDLYLDVVSASRPALNHSGAFHAPQDLLFTSNHWWLDATGDGPCHLGIDAFLARLLGPIDHITFATPHGIARPTAIFTVRGTDYTATFSELIPIDQPNLRLRNHPARLTEDPYSLGWLYEGMITAEQRRRLRESLLHSSAAAQRMEHQSTRLNQLIQSHLSLDGAPLAADGGLFAPGLLSLLPREESLVVFNELCPPAGRQERFRS